MTTPNRSVLTCLLLAAAAALLAVSTTAAGDDPTEIRMAQHHYTPAAITIPRGSTVRWVNDDDDPHTVTSDGGAFASRGIDTREEFTFTFGAPGTFRYHCALHPMMTGIVVVQ